MYRSITNVNTQNYVFHPMAKKFPFLGEKKPKLFFGKLKIWPAVPPMAKGFPYFGEKNRLFFTKNDFVQLLHLNERK